MPILLYIDEEKRNKITWLVLVLTNAIVTLHVTIVSASLEPQHSRDQKEQHVPGTTN